MPPSQPPTASLADLDWDDQGQPHSRAYGDVYFSNSLGLTEPRYVFLDNNDLPARFAALPAHGKLVIGETGFGTGLNFLCAWELFARTAVAGAQLHFVSVEKHPLSDADLQRALHLWPELQPFAEQLLEQYVALHGGFQRLLFDGGRVVLTLLIGDVMELLPQLDGEIDAWFLDGFAPAKNPEMWSPALFTQLARLSTPRTTLGTFTTAGDVRRALKAVGFKLKRVEGLGHKWQVLKGHFIGLDDPPTKPAEKAWYARPPEHTGPRTALVIGAGLAGCASAESLAARGWQVTLLERHGAIAQEGSGNPQGVLYLKLSAHGTSLSRLIVAGFGHTRRHIQRLQRGHDWDACGVLQLAFDEKEAARQAQLAAAFPSELLHSLSQTEAEQQAGIALASGGLFYPQGGWVHPPALCRLMAEHGNVQLRVHQHALQLRQENGHWQAWDGEQLLASASVVVLAGAADVRGFSATAQLPLKRIRGQITCLAQTAESTALSTVVCAEGYVAPARDGEHTLGASFDFHSDDLSLSADEHISNLQLLNEISTDLAQRLNADNLPVAELRGRAAFRCTSPDYLPIVGPVADADAFAQAYGVLRKDARQTPATPCPWLPGLYVNTGHGSRGLITAPLAAELLAAWLDNEPLPLPRDVAEACHPNRFMLRKLVRG
ncbi:MAG: bifunctional tRNA (5-methylaminomethyl-2-thiouridine)(34)-methyltransferase MnmD/FAD-dependent 5-carboxymethylaminomethyl-2-thiouridine(34) oxidoreductase MnmC [Pseudomonas sp.]|uniref:bifunctional tRNA (5-methylaminomethyl-2-thiouridine)(34)-methyltransferase MnmD/FAD-dependent 5-carboxymethylaminomethyl-2-thiouridine(34) oxidoreductase MnmC n=1 Tax=Pseudomonas sp. TaxID=306 RepID=UPI0030F20A39